MDSVLPFNHLDDDSFNLAIYELSFGPVIFDEDRLLSLKFNPLLPGNNAHSLALSSDLDPDSNFYSNAFNCDCYVEHKLNEILAKEIPNNPESLSFFQLNIRSLTRNFENLTNLLANINKKFSFIGISETWLQSSDHSVDMDGYYFVHTHRSGKSGGGVGLYVASNLEYKSRNDLAIEDTAYAESLFVEISRPKVKNVVVGVIYRPPNQNIDEFIIFLNSLTAKISKENKLFHLMGDFNLNLMNHHCHQPTSEFLDIMYSNMFSPLITRPTRITSNTATLIDNIFTNHHDNLAFSGLLFTDISDHLPIFCILYEQHIDTNYDKYIFIAIKVKPTYLNFMTGCETQIG